MATFSTEASSRAFLEVPPEFLGLSIYTQAHIHVCVFVCVRACVGNYEELHTQTHRRGTCPGLGRSRRLLGGRMLKLGGSWEVVVQSLAANKEKLRLGGVLPLLRQWVMVDVYKVCKARYRDC